MGQLYVVIYLAGLIGGTVGPLPYDMDECRSRIADMMAEATASPAGSAKVASEKLRMECEYHILRPRNENE